MSKPIVVVGSINMDLVARTPRVPAAGETMTGTGFESTPGGKGANQAVAVARCQHPVAMVGLVGEDVFGEALLANLRGASVDTESVDRVGGPSGVAQIQVADNGENSIVVVPGANGRVDLALIEKHSERIASAAMVLCQLEIPMEAVAALLALCARAGVPVMLDPAPAAALPQALWTQIAWFTPNETEAAFYVGAAASPQAAARQLLVRGLPGVVLKRGAAGSVLARAGHDLLQIDAFPVKAVDTVAAGDCFNGAFAASLVMGSAPPEAARFAAAAAALSVTRRGAQAAMPHRDEVNAFLAAQPNR